MSFKITSDFSELKKLSDSTKRLVKEALSDAKLSRDIGETVRREIVGVTRLGKSIVTGSRFPKLSESWIKTRKRIISYQGAPDYVSPRKSNISLSGQLLDSLRYRRDSSSGFSISFYFQGTHRQYKMLGRSGREVTVGKPIKNEDIARFLDKRYSFIGVRQKTQNNILAQIIDFIRAKIKK